MPQKMGPILAIDAGIFLVIGSMHPIENYRSCSSGRSPDPTTI